LLNKTILFATKWLIDLFLQKSNIFILFRDGKAIGDQLCMTAVISEIRAVHPYRIVVVSRFPQIFSNNPHVWKNIGLNDMPRFFSKKLTRFLTFYRGGQIERFMFERPGTTLEAYMRETRAKKHLTELHSSHFKIRLHYKNIKNQLFFSEQESIAFGHTFADLLPERYALIQPQGKTTYTPNKEWGLSNYQAVVDALPDVHWVQIGLQDDPLLNNVIDMRGQTSLRELFYIISKSAFILSNEGLLNHIASAFEGVVSFVVFSGFHPVEIALYENTIPIVKKPQVECAPCWLTEPCPKARRYCTEDIRPKQVVDIIMNTMVLDTYKND
jgi:ADP-heptose:LPS heptosyltransferase